MRRRRWAGHGPAFPCWAYRVLSCLLLLSCGAPDDATTPRPQRSSELADGCPSVSAIEAIHAAAFFAERADTRQAELHLARASDLDVQRSPEALEMRERLGQVLRAQAAGEEWSIADTETVRYQLTYWDCLPDSVHNEFHRRLPPIDASVEPTTPTPTP